MPKRYSVKLISASFNEESGTGILEYGVRLAKALASQKSNFDIYVSSIVKGNVLRVPKNLYKSWDTPENIKIPDIVHYIDPGFITIDAILGRLHLHRSKLVVTIHDLDMFKNIRDGLKLATKYTNPIAIVKKPMPALITPFAIFIRSFATKYVIKKAKTLVCVSEKTRDELVNRLKVRKSKCVVVYPIVSKEFVKMKRSGHGKKVIIGHFSSYLPNKNAGALIAGFKKTTSPNLELHLYGGTLPFKISDDKRIKYFGFVPTRKLPKILNSFDVFVFPSTWEGFGMPIMEAKRCKVPVITYAKAELPNVVKKNTIQFKDEDDLARIFETKAWKSIDVDKAYGNVRKCEEEFVGRQMLRLYSNILEQKN